MDIRPLSEGNALQRAYARWAEPHYARMAPELRERVELLDRFLYSRRGLGVWLGLLGAFMGSALGLVGTGMPWPLALGLAALLCASLPLAVLAAWLQPRQFVWPGLPRRRVWGVLALAAVSAPLGFATGHIGRHGELDPARLLQALADKAPVLVTATLAVVIALLALMWTVAKMRLELMERAQMRQQAAEAQLRLLQAQIQPHFIFNTLAALQHWVDTGDARAAGLLRALTAFLRGCTDLLGRSSSRIDAECDLVRQYLLILQSRFGARLRFEIAVDPACAGLVLPSGLVLTLVENAVEHGLAPTLAGGCVWVRVALEPRAQPPAGGSLVLSVRDDGAGLARGWREGTGLANLRQRLAHHGDGRGTLSLRDAAPGTEALLRLPLHSGTAAAAGCTAPPASALP